MGLVTQLTAQIGVGVGLVYGVVKFFDLIGSRLNADTNLIVAIWILDASAAKVARRWPSSCLALFNIVYGPKHFTWKCFFRSAFISIATSSIAMVTSAVVASQITSEPLDAGMIVFWPTLIYLTLQWCLCDYSVLFGTRVFVRRMARTNSMAVWARMIAVSAVVSICLSLLTAGVLAAAFYFLGENSDVFYRVLSPVIFALAYGTASLSAVLLLVLPASLLAPVIFTSVWLVLYAVSGFLLKLAIRADAVSDRLSRYVDIEGKPVQAIGLVAGVVVAIVYWCAVGVRSLL